LQAEKALKHSWTSLKFSADYLTASMEYAQAATKFRAANMLAEATKAWIRSAETKIQCNDQFGAGRAYESAGQISEGSAPAGGPEVAAEHWKKAIQCFRLAGKGEIAAKLLLKLAVLSDKQKNVAAAKEAFEEAIEVYQDDEKEYNLGEVYKQYIGFLVRVALYEDALAAMDRHAKLLVRQRQLPFAHKELLAKVVLLLHLTDTVRAEEALSPQVQVEGWFKSNECEAGHKLVDGFREYDAELVETVVKDQVFSSLQIEVARMARQLRVHGVPPGAHGGTGAAGGGGPNAAPPQQQAPPTTPEDIAELLM